MRKKPNCYWLIAAALAALPLASMHAQQAKTVPAPTSPVTGNVANGKALYYSYGCYACHGYTGETGPRPFVGRWGHLATEESFITFLRGRVNVAPVTPSGNMPNFSAQVLPDKSAKDLYAYIRTFKSNAPAAADPTLTAIVNAAKQTKN
jgi:mono/diheme cytochrome c family protein